MNATGTYPTGHGETIMKNDLPQNNQQWRNRNLYGMAKCTILPPKQLLHPVLPWRHKKSLYFPLCVKCVAEEIRDYCEHSDKERAISGTWCTIEIDKAIQKGYEIMSVQERIHFDSHSDSLFKGYVNTLYKIKRKPRATLIMFKRKKRKMNSSKIVSKLKEYS